MIIYTFTFEYSPVQISIYVVNYATLTFSILHYLIPLYIDMLKLHIILLGRFTGLKTSYYLRPGIGSFERITFAYLILPII